MEINIKFLIYCIVIIAIVFLMVHISEWWVFFIYDINCKS